MELVIPPTNRGDAITRLVAYLAEALPGKALKVRVDKLTKRRSVQQNRALWGVAYKVLADETGNDAEDLHVYFLGEWGGWEIIDVMGQQRRVPLRRSSKLSTEEFNDYYAFIQRRAAVNGYYVPDPNEDGK